MPVNLAKEETRIAAEPFQNLIAPKSYRFIYKFKGVDTRMVAA